ncbi:polysaccharide biosynthesis tyrosine autokinase [Propionicicella superfundia]|uniref:polysaccharide biosynthesis tyrosine autokinase n=1 Tax=Propionicicella superfundia TaxID=348582 RepID=UPI0004051D4D|nr:CpsD/CapB family tyrosine-protein kinase [Propionicicella superfundia]
MTFRHVLAIVWQRRVLALATALLVFLAALLYSRLAPVTYAATAQLRYSPAATSTLAGSTGYGSIALDVDPDYVTGPEIAEAAAKSLTGDSAAAVQASITTELVEGVRSSKLNVTATGTTAEQAKDRANAVAKAYTDHLAAQVTAGEESLRTQLTTQQKAQTDALSALNKNADDRLAQQRFNDASAQITQLQTQITSIESAGAPASILQQATNGTAQGVSLLTLLLVGLVSGVIAGAGIALIREQFDDRLRTIDDVNEAIGGPIIADIAKVSRQELAVHPLPAASRVPTPFNESVRTLRTSLQVVFPQRHALFALTSSEPGEGKTFLSANLAVSFAHAGRSVILVEADLRRPRVGTYFNLPDAAPGFADALELDRDGAAIARTLVGTGFPNLRILPAGSSRQEPADLLAGDSLGTVLGRLRDMADIVILDTPPGLALADAAIVGGETDGVIVVASLGRTTGTALKGTLQTLRANRAEVIGVVANKSRRANVKSYGGYYTEDPTAPAGGSGSAAETPLPVPGSPASADPLDGEAGDGARVAPAAGEPLDGHPADGAPTRDAQPEGQALDTPPARPFTSRRHH